MTITLFRTVILYLMVVAGLRLMGKRQVGDMQPGELVVTIMISELAAIPMQDLSRPIANGIIAITALVVMELVLSFILMKSNAFRRVMSGSPAIIVKAGRMDQKIMKAMRVTVEDLMEDLRHQGVFDIADVDYAIMETNGKLSVLKKTEKQETTLSDMNIIKPSRGLPSILVSDGSIMKEALQLTGFTEQQIYDILEKRKLSLEDVFLMMGDNAGSFTLVGKEGVPAKN